VPTPAQTPIKDFVRDGDAIRWGGFSAGVLHTPGHTPGSISLVVRSGLTAPPPGPAGIAAGEKPPDATPDADRLIAGDTLFRGSIGRTDLWGGSFPQIIGSIREKLLTLPDEVIVFPGHGETTTIGFERETNRFLR
jgi:glyoxylase-like metal-dependent hydrolase (beta-lactamase superfamily II)